MNKNRSSLLSISAILALLVFSSASQALPYNFSIGGFANGGMITGSFDADDDGAVPPASSMNGTISNLDGDNITNFMMDFVSGDFGGTMWSNMELMGIKFDIGSNTLLGLMATDLTTGLQLIFGEAAEELYGFNSAILVMSTNPGEILEANPPRPTPAPATLALFALGLVGLGLGRRRARS